MKAHKYFRDHLFPRKHFWRRCRGVATNQVDLKRARGNLQLHCKSGTFSNFSFYFILFQSEISVGVSWTE